MEHYLNIFIQSVFLENLAMFPAGIVSPPAVKEHKKAFATHPVGNQPSSIALIDADGDLDLDVAVANIADDYLSVLRNLGDGTFAPQVAFQTGDDPAGIAAGDVDADSDLDLVIANSTSRDVSLATSASLRCLPSSIS